MPFRCSAVALCLFTPAAFAAEPAKAAPSPASPEYTPLPKECAAESPADAVCTSYGGTYRITIRPGETPCFVMKPVTATVKIDGKKELRGIGHAKELEPLGRALGMKNVETRVGADVRDGVCCVDLRLSAGSGAD